MEKQNIKILLVDFDNWNSISAIFNVNKYLSKDKTKITHGLDIFNWTSLNFGETNKHIVINEFLKEQKKIYDFIIIDTTTNISGEYTKLISENSDKTVFLIEPNILEIKKANTLLEIYIRDWNIEINKIKIVFNKTNKYKITDEILKEIFSENQIIGEIQYNQKFNLFINKCTNEKIDMSEFEKIYNKLGL